MAMVIRSSAPHDERAVGDAVHANTNTTTGVSYKTLNLCVYYYSLYSIYIYYYSRVVVQVLLV